jgi:acyl-lipid (7-3)-desaturase (Delta-4 desaturase)
MKTIPTRIPMDCCQIDKQLYPVQELADIHPGGAFWVELFAGRDATHAFLSYHRRGFPHEKVRDEYHILVRSEQREKEQREKVLEDALELDKDYLELCEEVKRVVPVQKSFATFGYFVKTFCLLASSFSLEYWMHMTDTYDWKYTSILGLLFALIGMNIHHDANHGAISRHAWINHTLGSINNWIGGSAIDWIHQHVVQHHLYCNDMNHDPDAMGNIIVRLNASNEWNGIHRYQHLHIFLLFAVFGLFYSVKGFVDNVYNWSHTDYSPIIVRKYMRSETIRTGMGLSRWIILPMWGWWRGGAEGAPLWIRYVNCLPVFVVGGYYLSFFFILSHNFRGTVHTEVDTNSPEISFLSRQVTTSSNVGGEWLCWLNGGLNYQIEHHLFPRICHVHYPKLLPIVREFCKKKGITYVHFPTIWDNLKSCTEYLYDMGRKPREHVE